MILETNKQTIYDKLINITLILNILILEDHILPIDESGLSSNIWRALTTISMIYK